MVKYKKVKFNPKRILKLYAAGKNVCQIAQALGYPKGKGQNRTRKVLVKAGVYKKRAAK
jgi:hypothetical protein